jgi:hypothetical protein
MSGAVIRKAASLCAVRIIVVIGIFAILLFKRTYIYILRAVAVMCAIPNYTR